MTFSLEQASVNLGNFSAVQKFSGRFQPGTISALIGADGAGKSTLLRAIVGLESFTTPQNIPITPRHIGYMPECSGVWNNLSVTENIEFVMRVHQLNENSAQQRARRLLRLTGLASVQDRVAGKLSGGMRQKLGFILATLHQPSLILLDEPTTGVDSASRAQLWQLASTAAADGATVIVSSTYLDEAQRAHRVYFLAQGRLLAAGTPQEVIARTPNSSGEQQQENLKLEDAAIGYLVAASHCDGSDHETLASFCPKREGTAAQELVAARDVGRQYGGFTALHNVSLQVQPGEIVGLLGGNGAGKTTLMRILLGLETATSGSAKLFDQPPSLEARRRLGYVPQGMGLYQNLSAIQNLDFVAAVHRTQVPTEMRHIAGQLENVPVAALSLGTQRRLAYLAAVIHQPQLLILDEPTSGMDPRARAQMWKNLRKYADQGAGILVTTHYAQEAEQCDRLIILSFGKIAAQGTIQQILGNSTSTVVETPSWQQAFTVLRQAGYPVALDGKKLRVAHVGRNNIANVLADVVAPHGITEQPATLEETLAIYSQ